MLAFGSLHVQTGGASVIREQDQQGGQLTKAHENKGRNAHPYDIDGAWTWTIPSSKYRHHPPRRRLHQEWCEWCARTEVGECVCVCDGCLWMRVVGVVACVLNDRGECECMFACC